MTGKEAKEILERINQEGFDYCFVNYSHFEEIKDEEFHKLRNHFLTARKEFADYLGFED